MKPFPLLITLALGVLCTNCTKEDYDGKYTISKMEACAIVKPYIDQYPIGPVLVAKNTIPANKTLKYGELGHYNPQNPYSGTFKSPKFKSWLIVRQRDPSVEGSMDCNHYFVNVHTGEVVEKVIQGYVDDIEWDEPGWPYFDSDAVEDFDYPDYSSYETKSENSTTSNGKYAVIISGGGEKENNWKRYWNDCKHIYNTINHRLGFSDENIYCLVSDGTSSGNDRRIGLDSSYDSSPLDFDNDGDKVFYNN